MTGNTPFLRVLGWVRVWGGSKGCMQAQALLWRMMVMMCRTGSLRDQLPCLMGH